MELFKYRYRADEIIDYLEAIKDLEEGDEVSFAIQFNFVCGILVHKGIEKLAEAVGEGLFFENVNDDSEIYNLRAYFDYRGYRFVQYCKEEDINTEA
jgi:hypothetical protein